MWQRIAQIIISSYADEEQRRLVIFELLNLLLSAVALVMTIVNVNTSELQLMMVTAVFSFLCMLNYVMVKQKPQYTDHIFVLFSVEAEILLIFFVLSGIPNGFSVLWTLLVPTVGLSVFGMKIGMRFAVLTLGMILFFFWLPLGRDMLYFSYNETFMLRFPFVYGCLLCASAYVEVIRVGAYNKLKEMEMGSRYLSRHDALTGIYNRHAFYEDVHRVLEFRTDAPTCVLMFDIDDFKNVNDKYGHNTGDVILRTIAYIILKNTCEHCLMCRWGGEEFLVLMRCGHDPMEISEKIRSLVEASVMPYQGKEIRVTVSGGIAVADSLEMEDMDAIIALADEQLYRSKTEGKNRITMARFEK